MSFITFYLTALRKGLLLNLKLAILARLGGQQAFEIHLFVLEPWDYRYRQQACPAFLWVL